MSLKDYGLEGERLRRAVYLDAMEDYQLGDDQACQNYPMRYPTVEFELVDTIELCEIVDTIRKGKGYRPVLEEGGDTSAWYSMYLGLNGYTSTGLDTSILAIVVNSDSEDNEQPYYLDLSEDEQCVIFKLLDEQCREHYGKSCVDLLEEARQAMEEEIF